MILLAEQLKTKVSGNEQKNFRRKKRILSNLYNEGPLSATELGKRIRVSLPTAISLLKDLSDDGVTEVKGVGESKGGRRPVLFDLKADSILTIACELGRFKGKIAIFNAHNKAIVPISTFKASIDDEDLIEKIFGAYRELLATHNINEDHIYGFGLAMPGLVDEAEGYNYTIKKHELRNIAERIKERFNRVVYVNNDARMQAYGEYVFGEANGYKNALIINWSWGVGLGMILDGKLYNGATGFSGELSHIKFVEDGDLCICGKRGCLETVTSVYVLLQKARAAIREGKISQLTARFQGKEDELEVDDIIKAAKSGDEFSISLFNSVGGSLGKALANTIQLLNPDIIVLGGVVSQANQFVLTPIQQSIYKHCLEKISGHTQLVISERWERTGLLGTSAMLYKKLFSETINH